MSKPTNAKCRTCGQSAKGLTMYHSTTVLPAPCGTVYVHGSLEASPFSTSTMGATLTVTVPPRTRKHRKTHKRETRGFNALKRSVGSTPRRGHKSSNTGQRESALRTNTVKGARRGGGPPHCPIRMHKWSHVTMGQRDGPQLVPAGEGNPVTLLTRDKERREERKDGGPEEGKSLQLKQRSSACPVGG